MKLLQRFRQMPVREGKKSTMLVLHRKQIAAISLLILIAIAGYLNWTFKNDAVDPDVAVMYNEAAKKLGEAKMVNSSETETAPENKADANTANSNNYFAQAKLDREVKRSESIDMLTEIIDSQGADQKAKLDAETKIHALADYTEKEVTIENMIKAKGYGDAVAFITDDLVSIAVSSMGLNEVDAAVIQDIVTTTAGVKADKMKLVEIN